MLNLKLSLSLIALSILILGRHVFAAPTSEDNCSASSISIPTIDGIKIQSLSARPVHNFSLDVPQNGAGPYFDSHYSNLSFCNVTIIYSYTQIETGFSIIATVWLPPLDGWNGRFQATGGSGFSSGLGPFGLAPALASGYAAAETDGGHSNIDADPGMWALNGEQHVDVQRLRAFASTSLNDLAVLGKAVVNSFYHVPPKYSYWNGCSTGGRQGLMLAQQYPAAFDGILALSPAINWPSLTVSTYWPQQFMHDIGHYPHSCELAHITQQAIKACDADDGLVDGIISSPGLCTFDADQTIGNTFLCDDGVIRSISAFTAAIANAAWAGNGLWYGLSRGALLEGMANTTCTSSSDTSCTSAPFGVAPWIPYFLAKNPDFNLTSMSLEMYRKMFVISLHQYESLIGTSDPDLSSFRAAGGKMITTHGLDDPAIFPNGTIQYYKNVLFFDQHAQDFYRFFEAPGIGHCGSVETKSFYPNDSLEALVRWVEQGAAPDVLTAVSQRGDGETRPLCAYPKEQRYLSSGFGVIKKFECA